MKIKLLLASTLVISSCSVIAPTVDIVNGPSGSWVAKSRIYVPGFYGSHIDTMCAGAREAKRRGCPTFADKGVLGAVSAQALQFRCFGDNVTADVLLGC